jgi:hypothetical protein
MTSIIAGIIGLQLARVQENKAVLSECGTALSGSSTVASKYNLKIA